MRTMPFASFAAFRNSSTGRAAADASSEAAGSPRRGRDGRRRRAARAADPVFAAPIMRYVQIASSLMMAAAADRPGQALPPRHRAPRLTSVGVRARAARAWPDSASEYSGRFRDSSSAGIEAPAICGGSGSGLPLAVIRQMRPECRSRRSSRSEYCMWPFDRVVPVADITGRRAGRT